MVIWKNYKCINNFSRFYGWRRNRDCMTGNIHHKWLAVSSGQWKFVRKKYLSSSTEEIVSSKTFGRNGRNT